MSAGLGIFSHSYPLRRIANEVLELEDLSKSEEGKNRITLFDDSKEHTYDWETFKKYVLTEKYMIIKEYFDMQSDHGKSYIYKLISYIRNIKDKISIPRFLYLISRTKPEVDEIEKMEIYKKFSGKMFDWIESREDRRQLLTAMYLYVYLTREENDK